MAITDILQDIEAQKDKALETLEGELAKTLAELQTLHESNKRNLDENYNKRIDVKKASIKKKMKAQANMERKGLILTAKREVLNDAFAEAIKRLSTSDKYIDVVTTLLKKVDFNDAEVISAKGKKSETEQAIKAAGKNFDIKSEGDFSGGVIIVQKEVEIDLSFENLIESLRGDLETDVALKLFS